MLTRILVRDREAGRVALGGPPPPPPPPPPAGPHTKGHLVTPKTAPAPLPLGRAAAAGAGAGAAAAAALTLLTGLLTTAHIAAAFSGRSATLVLRKSAGSAFSKRNVRPVAMAAAPVSSSSSGRSAGSGPLDGLAACADHSWMDRLTADPDAAANAPNKRSREVKSGHWVPVLPSPLPQPTLVVHSAPMAAELGLDAAAVASPEFARFFSGDVAAATWARPPWTTWTWWRTARRRGRLAPLRLVHPLRVEHHGHALLQPALRERQRLRRRPRREHRGVVVPDANRQPDADPAFASAAGSRRWEMQLKGGGQTPFCRGADERRASVVGARFLASEAMHCLRVPTTRALSLICSGDPMAMALALAQAAAAAAAARRRGGEKVRREWYSGAPPTPWTCRRTTRGSPASPERRQLIRQLRNAQGGGATRTRTWRSWARHHLSRVAQLPTSGPRRPLRPPLHRPRRRQGRQAAAARHGGLRRLPGVPRAAAGCQRCQRRRRAAPEQRRGAGDAGPRRSASRT